MVQTDGQMDRRVDRGVAYNIPFHFSVGQNKKFLASNLRLTPKDGK